MSHRLAIVLLALAGVAVLGGGPAVFAEEEPTAPAATEEAAPEEAPGEEVAPEPVAPSWVYDIAAAKEQAAREGKDLFIDFTGSDWCGWCKRLDEEVFTHAEFVDAASKHYVFLYLDFPRRSEEAKAKVVDAEANQQMAEAYGVQSFPTIVLATADGSPYSRTGYRPGGPAAYVEHLMELHEGGQKVKALLAAKGSESLEVLKAGFEALGEAEFLGYANYAWILDDAEKMDPEGSNGLKELVEAERARQAAAAEVREFEKLFDGVSRREDVPFDKVRAFLDGTSTLAGQPLAMGCDLVGTWLLTEKQDATAAKGYFERALKDPLVQQNAGAAKHFEGMIAQCEESLASADEEPAEDE